MPRQLGDAHLVLDAPSRSPDALPDGSRAEAFKADLPMMTVDSHPLGRHGLPYQSGQRHPASQTMPAGSQSDMNAAADIRDAEYGVTAGHSADLLQGIGEPVERQVLEDLAAKADIEADVIERHLKHTRHDVGSGFRVDVERGDCRPTGPKQFRYEPIAIAHQ